MRLLYVIGTRPNIVKTAPVLAELRSRLPDARHVLVHTGQHYDHVMSDRILEDLMVPTPDHYLGIGSASLTAQTAAAMERLEPVLRHEEPDLVFVPGDVNSTLAASLVCAQLRIPYAHIESGLRSFDRTMPEEINRIVADEFAQLLFVHCEEAVDNLLREGIDPGRIHLVGNTMIDSLLEVSDRFRGGAVAQALGLSPGEYLLVTLHRPALVDGPLLFDVLDRLDLLARELPVFFPVHPRTQQMIDAGRQPQRVILSRPLGYLDFLALEANAAAVLTDSGGVQEETTFLGVPCFTLRDNTERPVTVRVGTNTLLGLDSKRIDEILPGLVNGREGSGPQRPPLWDGKAAGRVADVVERVLAPLVRA
jgi:UDP-N-acetylglucosamine 2-epimerase (non-hydrolysing)